MNEEINKALAYFGRKDLTDGLYENDLDILIDGNVQVFLTIRQMIKLYNLQSKIDKAIEWIEQYEKQIGTLGETSKSIVLTDNVVIGNLLDILKEDK